MNKGNDSSKLVYWGTAGCGSRSHGAFLHDIDILSSRGITHEQGMPEDVDHSWKVICMIRNPYTMCWSTFSDLYMDLHENRGTIEDIKKSFKEYIMKKRYERHFPDNYDIFYYNQWDKLGRTPDYFIRMEHASVDFAKIPNIKDYCSEEKYQESLKFHIFTNHHAHENQLDDYRSDRQQKITHLYDQEMADKVYNTEKKIFDIGEYDKDSWKYLN